MLVQIIRVLGQFTPKAIHEVINICNEGIKRFHCTLDLLDCFLYPWIFPNHLFLKTEVSNVVVEIGISRVVILLAGKFVYKVYVWSKTFHHVPSPPKQDSDNVQIEAPSPCNYPICCFRSASRSSRGPNRWILFVHSFIILFDLNSLTVCPQLPSRCRFWGTYWRE